jgi:hypothetical protein
VTNNPRFSVLRQRFNTPAFPAAFFHSATSVLFKKIPMHHSRPTGEYYPMLNNIIHYLEVAVLAMVFILFAGTIFSYGPVAE